MGESEFEIAGRMVGAMVSRGLDVPTCLVAVDDRMIEWRHFLPTNRRLERYAALSVCARKDGLVISCTRLVHFGSLPEDLRLRVEAVLRVDAELIAATKPGATSGQLFEVARRAYADVGFPDEWRNHHQGGLAGYRGREWFATPDGKEVIAAGQLVAWNPTVPGAKSEDTLLITPGGSEIITESEDFPYLEIRTGTAAIRRPGVLVR
jgi:Xaa-Pro aminopeptidase